MKKIIVAISAVLLSAGILAAQDLKQATDLYNNGATALSTGDKAGALTYFQQALSIAQSLSDDAAKEFAAKLTDLIPNVNLGIAKDLAKAGDFDAAVTKLEEVKKMAAEYKAEEALKDATELLPQIMMQKGNALIKAKDFAAAADVFKAILASDATNGMASLRLGMALAGAGDVDGAVEAYKAAAANGQEKNANTQISKLFLKKAAACLKAKDFKGAVAAALESNNYVESAQAYQIAGQSSQILKKNDDAVKYFEKYLEMAPTASNAGQIAYTVGALYQQMGNKAKAKAFYQKASSDPKLGAEAAKLAASL